MYADDHVPPHFHVVTTNGEALVAIEGLEVLRGSIDGRSLEAALTWARENLGTLNEEWRLLNER